MKYRFFANCGVCKGNIFFAFVSDKTNVSDGSADWANTGLVSCGFLIKVIMMMNNDCFLIVLRVAAIIVGIVAIILVVVIVILLWRITHS